MLLKWWWTSKSRYSKSQKVDAASFLTPGSGNWPSVTSPVFYWHKQVSAGSLNTECCFCPSLGSFHTCAFFTAKLACDDQIHILKQHRRKELETRQKQYRWVVTCVSGQIAVEPWFLLSQRHNSAHSLWPISVGTWWPKHQIPLILLNTQAPPYHHSKQRWWKSYEKCGINLIDI